MTLVVDASVAVDYLLGFGAFERISERLAAPGQTLHAPHLLDVEVAHALRRLSSHATITPARAQEALEDYAALRIRRHSHLALLPRIWELRANVSAFDAAYVALAEALDAPLITADAALARAPGHLAAVEVYR